MPPSVCQFLLCRIDHAVQVTGQDANHRLVPCLGIAYAKEFEQGADVVLVAVRVLATKAAHRIELVRLEVGRAGVQLIGMLLHPGTGHVVLA